MNFILPFGVLSTLITNYLLKMGMMPAPPKCFITDLEVQNVTSAVDAREYFVSVQGEALFFRFFEGHTNSEFVNANKHILYGLILNKRFPYDPRRDFIIDNNLLEKAINEAQFPKTPEEKANSLLFYLYSLQSFDGEVIKFPLSRTKEEVATSLFFKNVEEMNNYLLILSHRGFITGREVSSKDGHYLAQIKFTFAGLSKVIELNESGNQSKRAFIAMSFSPEQSQTREVIKEAIRECGYNPILIDEVRIHSETTINDAMLAEIKRSKFLVADFTQLKHGVYFEAGYGLGLGKPVIYLCSKADFENAHFDTNHYSHILYEDLDYLKQGLKDRIQVWID